MVADQDLGQREPPTLLYLMKQVELSVRAELDAMTRPEGLTALQYTALTVLERHPGLTSAHLARLSFVTAQSMADLVTALLDRGLIERHRDHGDRRRLVIALTEPGAALLDRMRPQVASLEEHMLSDVGAEQATQLRRSLEQCRRTLQQPRSLDPEK